MATLSRDPKVIQLAKDLGLPFRGDCLTVIREFALKQVDQIIVDSVIPIESLELLRRIVADKYGIRLEFIYQDSDVERIVSAYADFHSLLHTRLNDEFIKGDTEGITLERENWDGRLLHLLAVIDARGARLARAYFTAWHEVTHLIIHPEQLPIPGFRRTPKRAEIKNPIEKVVDHIAGKLAFYPAYFQPALKSAIAEHGGLTFPAIETARDTAAPSASLFATTMGSIGHATKAMVFVAAEMALKAEERRQLRSTQQTFSFVAPIGQPKLRVPTVVPNELAIAAQIGIRPNMRVPQNSVLALAHESSDDIVLNADEDQCWWESSKGGYLPSLPIHVHAVKRGAFVYGLISLA